MKFSKIAQGGIPPGYVEIEISVNEDGEMDTRITGHGEGTGCGREDDDALLSDLLNTEIEGFHGDFGQLVDAGKTKEGFETDRKKQKPTLDKPEDAPFLGSPFGEGGGGMKAPADERKMDLGFGV